MRAVWSFWSTPWAARGSSGWPSEKHHLLAWVLSFETARQHYASTALHTDDRGARLLIEGLGLEFDHVFLDLNQLADREPSPWTLGKLYAYRAQTEPFVHIDADVFLWRRLPPTLEKAPVFAQHPEPFHLGTSHYKPEVVRRVLARETRGWVPPEWEWALSFGPSQSAACCGIFGGNRIDFITYYADLVIRLIESPQNTGGWSLVGGLDEHAVLLEQYHLTACVNYHRNRPDSPYRQVALSHLFSSWGEALNANRAAQAGFTHLLASAKGDSRVADRIEQRVKRDYPDRFERLLRLCRDL